MLRRAAIILSILLCAGLGINPETAKSSGLESDTKIFLKDGWAVQSSAEIKDKGDALSNAGFSTADWYQTSVPSTVLAALIANGLYPDAFFGMNFLSIPGSMPPGMDVSSFRMPPKSPFRRAWWYRTQFELPQNLAGKNIRLHFNGINFRANIWMNGIKVAGSEKVAGTFRYFEFDVTDLARPGQTNALAVEIFPPKKNDLAFSWVDWNPAPQDRDMGIWREVFITAGGPVILRHPHVATDLDLPSLDIAHLSVTAEVQNVSGQIVQGTLRGKIEDIQFSREVQLAPGETKMVTFTPENFPALNVKNPRLWWPAHHGPQNLYRLELSFECNGQVSDRASTRFGIREITSELTGGDWLLFKFNGKNILIRGAGWAPDMMFRTTPERLEAEIRYVRDMNLNTIRLEGKLESDRFYELCDEYGILVMAGWCCCNHWERWWKWDREDYIISEASQRDQIKRLRNHPSMLAWLNGSDYPPPPRVESVYLKVLDECSWQNPCVSSAAKKPTRLTGPSGTKMTGPYEYVPPVYWYADTRRGGAFGFTAETSPGPAVPPIESLRLMIPEDHLWPIDKYWDYHCGRGLFADLNVFTKALEARYGNATGVEDYAKKSQAMTYDGQRAMFEAFARNKFSSTGVIQWMLNNGWPSLIWHLYDYYLRPGGGYYGTMKACEPLHVQYSYDDRSVVVVNSYYRDFAGMAVSARVYNIDMTEKFSKQETINVGENSSTRVFTVPELSDLSTTYFIKLYLKDSNGSLVSENFYWLSTKPDDLNWIMSSFSHTPVKSHADLTGLNSLPEVELNISTRFEKTNDEGKAIVTIENPTPHLAFLVHMKVNKGHQGEEILPVFWQDNYFSLLPGEKREVAAAYYLRDLGDARPVIEVGGWNVLSGSY